MVKTSGCAAELAEVVLGITTRNRVGVPAATSKIGVSGGPMAAVDVRRRLLSGFGNSSVFEKMSANPTSGLEVASMPKAVLDHAHAKFSVR